MTDKCDRCGEDGQDRRTLWMACLYDMGELGMPFKELEMKGTIAAKEGVSTDNAFGVSVSVFGKHLDYEKTRRFYTLRVCKNCRADWMDAQKRWFRSPPTIDDPDDDQPTEYTRHLGATRPAPEE